MTVLFPDELKNLLNGGAKAMKANLENISVQKPSVSFNPLAEIKKYEEIEKKEKPKEEKEEDEDEELVYEEDEFEDETDYNQNYFDNGEEYGDYDDGDEGPVY